MFTGIIQAIGSISAIEPGDGDTRLRIHTGKLDLADVQLGDSIAVNGVCLTAVELPGDGFWADVSQESLEKTTLARLQVKQRVNLEKALTPSTRLGGHLVSGQTIYVKLREGATIEELAYRRDDGEIAGGLKMANGTNPLDEQPFPGTRAKSAALVRQAYIEAQAYRDKLARSDRDDAGRPERDLGKEARSAPHETFWEFPYEKFVDLVFPVDWGEDADL
ncbi:MAG: hypothetical protein P8Z67_03615, partial [Gammaproteobacteria bacterium]